MPNDSKIQSALLTPLKKDEQASWGVHAPLIVYTAPAGAEATIGLPLDGLTLSVNGDYTFLINTKGLASTLRVHVRATLSSATVTSAGPDAITLIDPAAGDDAGDGVVLASGTGDGSVSTGTLQTASLTLIGAQYAIYTLTVASAGTAAFTVAEYTGL